MRRFRFGLQTVLQVRQTHETRLKQELAVQSRVLTEEYQKLAALQNRIVESENEVRAQKKTQVDMSLERAYHAYLQSLDKKIKSERETILRLEIELKRQQVELIKARKAVKVLEKLRERRLEEYQKNERRQDQKDSDDLTSMRHSASSEA
jgi:flagellar FliJ protein